MRLILLRGIGFKVLPDSSINIREVQFAQRISGCRTERGGNDDITITITFPGVSPLCSTQIDPFQRIIRLGPVAADALDVPVEKATDNFSVMPEFRIIRVVGGVGIPVAPGRIGASTIECHPGSIIIRGSRVSQSLAVQN
ncbi:hypothetical protein SDC9_147862 [bioreactor metagenome]|uniref:Uncharacterized protein n=1 Tax=bioreactor metagenome TaxID=1076179 RepID=A0A645EGU5_9ZZZZ